MHFESSPTGLVTLTPNVVVACENQEYDDRDSTTLLTPTVVIEVLSHRRPITTRNQWESTTGMIDSLPLLASVSQDSMQIAMYRAAMRTIVGRSRSQP